MVPAKQLHDEIDERLLRGKELLDRTISDEAGLQDCRAAYNTWTEYNEALLRRSFDSIEFAEEYSRRPGIGVYGGAPDPLSVRWDELRGDIAGKTRRLSSIQERLPLYRLHRTP
jgi:hypothetical protein